MSLEKQSARIRHINEAERENRAYCRRIRIHDYLPGQAIYSLGDYPARIDAAPTEYDRRLIPQLAKDGVRLIQLHEEWNDPVRLYGGDKFHAVNPEGMKEFVRLCHDNGIKVIAYVSSGYFQITDPDWKAKYGKLPGSWKFNCFDYTKGSHGNADWREFIIPKTLQVMDEYGFDGIFNDWGYDGYTAEMKNCILPKDYYDPEAEDLLSLIYSEIRKRGGIYKLHCDRNNPPPCRDRVCDYLWIGEAMTDRDIGVGKDFAPYVVPCQDRHFDAVQDLETYLAYTIPFLQFPLMKTGRPLQGNNMNLPGVQYYGGDEQEFFTAVGEYMKDHPDGPFIYSLWSSIPDDVREPEVWRRAMALYAPMVTENSLAYIELRESEVLRSELPQNVYVSMFVNEETYLVASNLTGEPYTLVLKGTWRDRVTGEVSDTFSIEPEKLRYLIRE